MGEPRPPPNPRGGGGGAPNGGGTPGGGGGAGQPGKGGGGGGGGGAGIPGGGPGGGGPDGNVEDDNACPTWGEDRPTGTAPNWESREKKYIFMWGHMLCLSLQTLNNYYIKNANGSLKLKNIYIVTTTVPINTQNEEYQSPNPTLLH